MAKIERKYLAHFIDVGFEVYERLGKDLEEYSPSMSAQVDVKKNIMGETAIQISGYEKTAAVEPYYAEEGSKLFEKLQAIIDGGLVLDDLRVQVIEVKLWENTGEHNYTAYAENAYIEITSYGGDTTGYQIPFTLHYVGDRVKGSFDLVNMIFTPEK